MTAIRYPDIVAWSPRRNFRCEATSPHNLPEWHPGRVVTPTEFVWPGAFQEEFEFALYEGSGEEALWTVRQAQVSETSPHAIHVSDGGWCVVRTHGPFSAGLVTISPEGRVVHSLDLLQEVFVGRWTGYVHETSAGPFWSGASHSYFTTLDGREFFCARTWWGQRLLLDLEGGQRADETPHSLTLDRLEARWACETLEAAQAVAATWQGKRHELDVEWSAVEPIKSATAVLARLRPDGAEARLRPFESCGLLTWSTSCEEAFERPRGARTRRTPRVSWSITCYEVRVVAALGLRRLGASPEGFTAFAIHSGCEDDEVRLAVPDRIADRDGRAEQVRPGMTGQEVVELVGAPDHAMREWEYDLLELAKTLRIRWNDGVVEAAELVAPGWLGETRDHHVFA